MAGERQRDEFERATLIGYQAVSVYVQTMNKKKMPKFSDLIRSKRSAGPVAPEVAAVMLDLLAARMGGKVRPRMDATEVTT